MASSTFNAALLTPGTALFATSTGSHLQSHNMTHCVQTVHHVSVCRRAASADTSRCCGYALLSGTARFSSSSRGAVCDLAPVILHGGSVRLGTVPKRSTWAWASSSVCWCRPGSSDATTVPYYCWWEHRPSTVGRASGPCAMNAASGRLAAFCFLQHPAQVVSPLSTSIPVTYITTRRSTCLHLGTSRAGQTRIRLGIVSGCKVLC
jgi:hypothetical protein